MDADTLNVLTDVGQDGGVLIAASGYLDDEGGATLARETCSALASGECRLCIDLHDVSLFNCSGARRLVAVLEDLRDRGQSVELIGANLALQKVLDLAH